MVAKYQHPRAHDCSSSRRCWRHSPLNRFDSFRTFGLWDSTLKKFFLGLPLVRPDTGGAVVSCLFFVRVRWASLSVDWMMKPLCIVYRDFVICDLLFSLVYFPGLIAVPSYRVHDPRESPKY